ncbi:MAG TPA: GNAT family N-acetyltransferase [Tissierellia bacterium]|nr:GNAT family N-acetyltransferase [Tissierellia bacterium]
MRLSEALYIDLQTPRLQDASGIIDYLNRVGGESDNLLFGKDEFSLSLEQEEAWIRRMNEAPTSAAVLAIAEGEIIGLAALTSSPQPRIAHHGEIALSVCQDYWNQGVGRELMKYLIRFAKNNGVTEIIHLGVRSDNQAALKLYRELGFYEIGRFPRFFKIGPDYFDEILMNLEL